MLPCRRCNLVPGVLGNPRAPHGDVMELSATIRSLHPLEVRVLRAFGPQDELSTQRLERELGFKPGHANQAFSWLSGKGFLAEARRVKRTLYELTELGREYAAKGTPEERLVALVEAEGPRALPDLCARLGLENKDAGSAFGQLSKEGVLTMDAAKLVSLADRSRAGRLEQTRALLQKAVATADGILDDSALTDADRTIAASIGKKRGAAASPFRAAEREDVYYRITLEGVAAAAALAQAGITGEELNALTPEILAKGSW